MTEQPEGPDLEGPHEIYVTSHTCCVAGCSAKAVDMWLPSVCAVREAGVEVGYMAVCVEHDIELNNYTTRFFFGAKYDKELADYATRRRAIVTL